MLIRLSPSGPPITNDEGGTAVVGSGFTLRLNEGTTTVDTSFGAWTPATDIEVKYNPSNALLPFLRPALADPSAARRYRITGALDLLNVGVGTATITSRLDVSYDLGVTWGELVRQESLINTATVKHLRIDMPLNLGSVLATPVPVPAPATMTVRLVMQSSAAGVSFAAPDGTTGAAFLQLIEAL